MKRNISDDTQRLEVGTSDQIENDELCAKKVNKKRQWTVIKRTMREQKFTRLVAIAMLIMIVNPAYCAAIDDSDYPDEKRSPAQIYYDQIPDDSE